MEPKTTEIRGRSVRFYESSGSGPTVLLVHGNSCSSRCFVRQFESPLARRFHLIAVDLPGHGGSEPPTDPATSYSLGGFAEFLLAFIHDRGIEDAVMFGWSLGGHVLLEAADRLRRAAGIAILGAPPIPNLAAVAKAFHQFPEGGLPFTEHLTQTQARAMADAFMRPGVAAPRQFMDDIHATDPAFRKHLLINLTTAQNIDEVVAAQGLEAPLLVVHGVHDRFINLEYIRRLALPTLWRGEIQLMLDAGHAAFWEQPKEFNNLLASFVEEATGVKTTIDENSPKEFMYRWFEEVWNKGDADAIPAYRAEKSRAHGLEGLPLFGVPVYKDFQRMFKGAFPDLHIAVEEMISEGEMLAVRATITGTHTGGTLGIPATNRPIHLSGMFMAHVVDGKVVESWNSIDFLSLFQQIGAIEPPIEMGRFIQ